MFNFQWPSIRLLAQLGFCLGDYRSLTLTALIGCCEWVVGCGVL
jgi:hypothetical protein